MRPFGVSLLVAGFDSARGPSLYQVDPSGSYFMWKASAIGKNMTNAKTFLEKRCVGCACVRRGVARPWLTCPCRYNDEISLEDAIHTAVRCISNLHCGLPLTAAHSC